MHSVWPQFVNSLGNILRLLRQGRQKVVPVGADDDYSEEQPDWSRSEFLLDSVPLPTAEYGYLKCRIENSRRYYEEGEIGAAAYEITLALQRACRLYG
jgi:hypothetical protein